MGWETLNWDGPIKKFTPSLVNNNKCEASRVGPGLGWHWFGCSPHLPGSAWADGKLAELAEQVGKMVEHLGSKSTQPNYPTRWTTLLINLAQYANVTITDDFTAWNCHFGSLMLDKFCLSQWARGKYYWGALHKIGYFRNVPTVGTNLENRSFWRNGNVPFSQIRT